ncbi:MAG: hypothetical protein HYR71_02845 [Chloroflexi bacterium]|nr:hypothetical protein [Chloroflexota bacterium]
MSDAVTLIIFSAGAMHDDAERLVTQARHAITADVVARARQVKAIERIIVTTDSPELIASLQPYDVVADYDDPAKPFAFGARLAQIIVQYDVQKPFYIGGGAAALLSADELGAMAERLQAADNILIPNNLFSSDFVAFAPGRAAVGLPPLETDNNLAFLLRFQEQLAFTPQPRTVGTQFDVDTPTDVLLLGYGKNLGEHTRRFLSGVTLDTSHIERLLPHLTRHESELCVYGRVAAEVWLSFERDAACRTRLFSEERGLLASGREARGEARSLLGFVFDAYGIERSFALLGELGTAALIDMRVLLAHRRLRASAHDRFNADLLRPEQIHDPWLREFTQAALRAPIPVILGGHSLVCGGLYLLVEAAWRGK